VWEFRNTWRVHSFSTLLSWAGIERLERLVRRGQCRYNLEKLLEAKKKAEGLLQQATFEGSVRNSTDDESFDASMALMAILRYPDKTVCKKTIEQLYENLTIKEDGKPSAFFYRYLKKDDFGKPKSAFLACSFWAAQSFAAVGDKETARRIVERTFESRNKLGLYAEHYEPAEKIQLGNFPQAYSHVGLINSAFAVSPPWGEVL
jgi:GH15 family glucan-1,4-alpha-glucosidase